MANYYDRADVIESVTQRPMLLHLAFRATRDGFVEASGGGYQPLAIAPGDWEFGADGRTATFRKVFGFTDGLKDKVRAYWLTRPGAKRVLYQGEFPGDGYDIFRPEDTVEVEDTLKL